MRWVAHVARMGDMRNTYKILAVKSEWTIPVGRLKIQGTG